MTQGLLVNIDVDDLALAEAFYTRAFGLRTTRRFRADGVELAGAAVPLYLLGKPAGSLACDAPANARCAMRDYARHWTPVHLDFVVDDLDAALARAESAGARREGEVRRPHGVASRRSSIRSATACACCSSSAAATTRCPRR